MCGLALLGLCCCQSGSINVATRTEVRGCFSPGWAPRGNLTETCGFTPQYLTVTVGFSVSCALFKIFPDSGVWIAMAGRLQRRKNTPPQAVFGWFLGGLEGVNAPIESILFRCKMVLENCRGEPVCLPSLIPV